MEITLTEAQKIRSSVELISKRILELRGVINYYEDKMSLAKNINEKRIYERKREWIYGILDVNEQLHEQFKKNFADRLH